MRKIINGLRYDTETARRIGHAKHSYPKDFFYWSDDLYVTKSGRYFLAGEGGAMSHWGKSSCGNSYNWSSGQGIRPLSRDDALAWAESYLTAAEIKAEAAFGEAIADA